MTRTNPQSSIPSGSGYALRMRLMDEPGCRAFCVGCFMHCAHDDGHEGAHETEHSWRCEDPKFFVAKVCSLCRKAQIREDWDICRSCAVVIELEQTTDPEARRAIVHEVIAELCSRARLGRLLP